MNHDARRSVIKERTMRIIPSRIAAACLVLLLATCLTALAQAPTFTVLYTFTGGTDGGGPQSNLIMDAAGNLYGTTAFGGSSPNCSFGCGTVFKLDPSGNETVLHAFTGTPGDGARPFGGLIMDAASNLYGTTQDFGGCDLGCGIVFKLDPSGNETVLHTFTGSDGANPSAGLIMDAAGNLYGTTPGGGASGGCGTVFKI